ncbi:hypothetical protein CPB86DRAFT_777678 [Serendipita vermifera]|nr:hypothetical protein CPB86DRAFT_777678 [Serendipita vermifera]
MPFMGDESRPNLVLKTRAMIIENVQELLTRIAQSDGQGGEIERKQDNIEKMWAEATTARRDFEQHGKLERLEQAISRYRTAIEFTPEGDPRMPGIQNGLAISLFQRFGQLGRLHDIDEAIERLQIVILLTPDNDSNKPTCLTNLGGALTRRFERLGNLGDLDKAIQQQEAAPSRLNNLGTCLQVRFERLGRLNDIEDAIIQLQQAPSRLINLGSCLRAHFLQSGNIADIDVRLTSDDHPDKSGYLSNLGSSLQVRFDRLENLADLDSAIMYQQHAVGLRLDSHPDKPGLLNNLGTSLRIRFQPLGNRADIENAILQYQKAVSLTPAEHPAKPMWVANLGASLRQKFNHFGNLDDIDNAIMQLHLAVDITPDTHPSKSNRLGSLGASLRDRFIRLGNVTDLDDAIRKQEQALNLAPMTYSDRISHLFNLALYFLDRFKQFHDSNDAEIDVASLIKHDSLLDAYGCALELMPRVAWLGLPVVDRHRHLIKIGGIVRDAAAAAISGRSIVWTQILQLRTPVDQLREVDPGLADRLVRVSRLLDGGSRAADFSYEKALSAEEEGRQYRALTAEWESIVNQIRSLPQFENFLRPPILSQLMNASQNGPVVVFNISKARCDALALLPELEDVTHIPLPNVTSESVTELRDQLEGYLCSSGIRMRDIRATERDTEEVDKEACRRVLSEPWTHLVKPVLDSLAFTRHPSVFPRIWWSGIYGPDSDDSQLSNYVISSYTPTVSTLLELVKPTAISSFNLLSVIQSSAPDASFNPNTKKELEYIQQRLSGRDHIILEGSAGTKKRVMEAMKDSNWLHLACHGTQRVDEPTKSALLLDDGRLTLEEIIKLDLPHPELAFLSACQTTTGDEKLSEEAVHIAGGMLLAGYRSVVATMWSIQDNLAPTVTNEFYRHIMEEGK